MKSIKLCSFAVHFAFIGTLIFLSTSMSRAQNPSNGRLLDLDAVRAIKAVNAVSDKYKIFDEATDLEYVGVEKPSRWVTIYTLSGKRVRQGGYRKLRIVEERSLLPEPTVDYKAYLIP